MCIRDRSVGLCVCFSRFLQFVCDFVCWCLCLCLCWCLSFCEYWISASACVCVGVKCLGLVVSLAFGFCCNNIAASAQQQHCNNNSSIAATALAQHCSNSSKNSGPTGGTCAKFLGNPCHQFPEFGNPYGLGALGSQDP